MTKLSSLWDTVFECVLKKAEQKQNMEEHHQMEHM